MTPWGVVITEAQVSVSGRMLRSGERDTVGLGDLGLGVPAVEVVGEGVVEDSGAYLQEEECAAGAPPHLLLFDHADHLVGSGLSERGEMASPARRRSP